MPNLTVSDGTHLYYEDFGSGNPIVFVHGGAATHAVWEQQVCTLADEFRTITYDLRGAGHSGKPRDGYTADRYADDLAELIDTLGLNNATIVTHGFGGHISLRALHRHPQCAAKLILGAAAPWFVGNRDDDASGGQVGGFSDEFEHDLSSGIAADYAGTNWNLIENWLFYRDPGMGVKISCLAMAQSWPSYAITQLMRDLSSVDHRAYLPDITQPALILHGVHDRKNRFEGSDILAKLLPNAELMRFENSAHSPFFEEHELFNHTVAEFVRSV